MRRSGDRHDLLPGHGPAAAGHLHEVADPPAQQLAAERGLRGEDEDLAVVDPEFESAGPRPEKIPGTASAGGEFDERAQGDHLAGPELRQGEGGVEREAGFDFTGELGLALGEVGGLLAVGVVFARGAALLADGLVAGGLGGADLKGEFGAELGEDGLTDGGFVHAAGKIWVKSAAPVFNSRAYRLQRQQFFAPQRLQRQRSLRVIPRVR